MDTNSRISQLEKKLFIFLLFTITVCKSQGNLIERLSYGEKVISSRAPQLIPCGR